MNTYAEFDKLLQRAGKPVPSRKIANNTYAQRHGNGLQARIAVKFHDTDVVTFYLDGTITLDSGGWLTMATKERMNRFLPDPVRVHSIKGRWMVTTCSVTTGEGEDAYTHPDYEHSAPFVDGMWLAKAEWGVYVVANGLSRIEQARQDAHNARIEKLLDAYLRWLTAERYEVIFQDHPSVQMCGMCVRTGVGTLVGDAFEDKQHLIEHLLNKDMPFSVFYVACDHARGADGRERARFFDLAKRDVRAYLRQQLYVGPVAIKRGKRPAHSPPWSLTTQLNKPKSRRKPA